MAFEEALKDPRSNVTLLADYNNETKKLKADVNGSLLVSQLHADGTEGNLITGVDYVAGKSGIDRITETLQAIEYEHHEIHAGSHYFVEEVVDLAINAVFDIQFTTPDTTSWSHFTFQLDCESGTEWYIYENAIISTAGTTITPINNNRNSTNISGNTVAWITNSSVANANADTAVAGATQLGHGAVASGNKSLGNEARSNEIVLKQNTVYCFRAIANAAGYIDYKMSWYEHINKN